ncbi:MAG: DUF1476 domain-containing protein [Beijerinckiaceae bacterium]|nr:DUF1476 domain-containing protein [Beijerinckiaceae bacterium]
MTVFDQREQGFEAKFVQEQTTEFRIKARRNHLLGLWAGGLMGLKGDELALYTGTVLSADLAEPGDDDVFRKIVSDFAAAKIEQSDRDIHAKMEQFLTVAKREVLTGE